MYDMYPDAWTVTEDESPQQSQQPPQRRSRKKHSVQPAVIARHLRAESGPVQDH
jgi:hypothetical protein